MRSFSSLLASRTCNKTVFLNVSDDTMKRWRQQCLQGDSALATWQMEHYNASLVPSESVCLWHQSRYKRGVACVGMLIPSSVTHSLQMLLGEEEQVHRSSGKAAFVTSHVHSSCSMTMVQICLIHSTGCPILLLLFYHTKIRRGRHLKLSREAYRDGN